MNFLLKSVLAMVIMSCSTSIHKTNDAPFRNEIIKTHNLGDLALTCAFKPTALPAPMRPASPNARPQSST